MTMTAPALLDLAAWPRRDAFEFFRDFDKPWFNVCTRVDVARLKQAVAERGRGGLTLAYHFLALRLANAVEPFRYRLDGERVLVHPRVNGSTTVLREDGSFGFAYLDYLPDFDTFAARGAAAIARARAGDKLLELRLEDTAKIHCTTLPWLHFSSFSHARHAGPDLSVPKLAFGRIDVDGARAWMPLSVEVHHALMDGLHVGQFVQGFEAALIDPEAWLGRESPA
jgi:chloramphenicol O-acetyltransferase type A